MKEEYRYRFYPPILSTNRQVESEAGHVLYAENLLVRVSSCGRTLSADVFGGTGGGHAVPILASRHHAKRFTRHVMELIMLRDYEASFDGHPFRSENCFVIASDDLPQFCWALLVKNVQWDEALSRLALAIEIRRDIDTPTAQEKATTESQNELEGQGCNDDGVGLEGNAATNAIIPIDRVQTSTKCTETQTRRLLEPFRRLHSVQAVHIEGPIIEQYRARLLASMRGPGPNDQELFDAASAMLGDALITYDTGDVSSAVTKMKYTLDTIEDNIRITLQGPHPPPPLSDAYEEMKITIWAKLGWASLKNRENLEDVMDARSYVETIIWTCVDEDGEYWNAPPMGHKVAMVFYMWANVCEALDDLEYYSLSCRSYCLAEVVMYLCEGLRHEPGSKFLEQQLRRREEELRSAEEVEALMEMFDRINETGDFTPLIYLRHDEDDDDLGTEDEGEGS